MWTWISRASSIKSSRFSSEPGTCLKDVAETSATFAISGTSSTRSSPDNDGATPPLPVSVEEMVPPSEIMVTAGRVIEPPYCPATLSSGSSLNGEPDAVQRADDSYCYTFEREGPSVLGSAWYSTAGERRYCAYSACLMAARQVPSCSTVSSTSSTHRRHLEEWPERSQNAHSLHYEGHPLRGPAHLTGSLQVHRRGETAPD
jgi:hypothetical protein